MKSFLLVSALSLFSFSSLASTLICIGTNVEQNVNVQATIDVGNVANVKAFYGKYNWTQEENLPFDSEGQYVYSFGECADQMTGGQDYLITVEGSTAKYQYFWCDADGGSGHQEYELTCKQEN